ncbi:hypothetical protein K2173_028161 [Erythroxylum novogranatense]|uniref:Uncharacterized protein n=1 Tax=Erythroxylum novogranatense TaxID=1862640 RepID=A0AAV8U422_9ROSI|nr:hypothetical protein K2173_028161 [Erythroxylum novogranatense]
MANFVRKQQKKTRAYELKDSSNLSYREEEHLENSEEQCQFIKEKARIEEVQKENDSEKLDKIVTDLGGDNARP